MKYLLPIFFCILFAFPLFAQKANIGDSNKSTWVKSMTNYSYRYEVRQNDSINTSISITRRNNNGHFPWKNVMGLTILGISSNQKGMIHEHQQLDKNVSMNVSAVTSLAALNIFTNKKSLRTIVEAKQFDRNGNLLLIERLKEANGRRGRTYTLKGQMKQDGFVVISLDNINKIPILVNSTTEVKSGTQVHEDSVMSTTANNNLRIMAPAPSPGDWHNLNEVVITGSRPDVNYIATVNAENGGSNSWAAVSGGVGGGGGSAGGGGGGGSGGGAISPEEKRTVIWLNEFGANKCEGQYVVDHAISDPLMGPKLLANKKSVVDYMNEHNLRDANTNGASVQNAFKHALFSAYNYCSIGENHANVMANYHEFCGGQNMNPSQAEWNMDDYNNHRGFDIAKQIGCNQNNILAAVWAAYEKGGLRDINGNPTYQ